jgi:hypothetical protein
MLAILSDTEFGVPKEGSDFKVGLMGEWCKRPEEKGVDSKRE